MPQLAGDGPEPVNSTPEAEADTPEIRGSPLKWKPGCSNLKMSLVCAPPRSRMEFSPA